MTLATASCQLLQCHPLPSLITIVSAIPLQNPAFPDEEKIIQVCAVGHVVTQFPFYPKLKE